MTDRVEDKSAAKQEVVLEFELRQRHALIASPSEWADFVGQINSECHADLPTGIDGDSLSAVYEFLDSGDWRADELLHSLGTERNTWYDNGDTRLDDIRVEAAAQDGILS